MSIGPTLAWLLLALLAPGPGSREARITDLSVAVDGQRAMVSLRLAGAFDDRFRERAESGLATGVVYRLELVRDRKRWYDKGLDETTFQVVAMYDALTRQYLVNYKLAGKLVETRMARDLDELERAVSRVEDLPAFRLEGIDPGARLQVRARAELGARTILSFIPATVATDWVESAPFRTDGSSPGAAP